MYALHMPSERSDLTSEERETIRRNCKKFREEAGFSFQELANVTRRNGSALWRYEKVGHGPPDRDAMRDLAAVYGRSVDDFYSAKPPEWFLEWRLRDLVKLRKTALP